MKILGSSIAMSSNHSLEAVETRQETFRMLNDARAPTPVSSPMQAQGDQLIISQQARDAYKAQASSITNVPMTMDPELFGLSPEDKLFMLILEKLLGIKIEPAKFKTEGLASAVRKSVESAEGLATALQEAISAAKGFAMSYQRIEKYAESETLSFKAEGFVNTSDGKSIPFSVEMNLKRQFSVERSFSWQIGEPETVDPLVINYDGPSADLTNTKFIFDIDFDGCEDLLPMLASGSGFLAIDWNGDGAINDGRELFGPTTGNGFAELAALDSDGNRWLDEADPAFSRIRIWNPSANGAGRLFTLGDKGIGAIYLGSASGSFSLKNEANTLLGQNTGVGIFLKENGQPGTIQQIDLVAKKAD